MRALAYGTRELAVGLILLAVLCLSGCGDSEQEKNVALAVRYVAAGDEYLAQDNRKKAIAAYTKAIELDPKSKKAYLCRAMALSEVKRNDEALADFTKAIELDPRDSFPYERRAAIYRTVYHDEAKAKADDQRADLIRQKRWSDLQKMAK